MNYLLTLIFDGAGYHGWQRQSNADSVQAHVEDAVEKLFGAHCTVYGCSRTDAGVHANVFKANFICAKEMDPRTVVSGMNFFLPDDICVVNCEYAPATFNARFSCVSKEYIYKIYNSTVPNPFYRDRVLFYKVPIDVSFLDRQAQAFVGTHDFAAFCAAGSSVKSTVRTVKKAGMERDRDLILFRVEADGFLYNMVRIMVGTLLAIGEGKIAPDSIPEILESRQRVTAGKTIGPEGLYLNRVRY